MKNARVIIAAIGVLLLLNAIVMLFVSNFNVGPVLQLLLSAAVLTYAYFFKILSKQAHIAAAVLALLPLIMIGFLAVYGNINNADYSEDVVIVLGAGIRGETVGSQLAMRLDKAVEYHQKNPQALIVVCGGQGPQEDITEALAMERYLITKGVATDKILQEDKSTSTYENLTNAKPLLDALYPDGFRSVVITSDYHIYRAASVAKSVGVPSAHIGAGTVWYSNPSNYIRECLAVIRMWLF